jgi:hypothetical protein
VRRKAREEQKAAQGKEVVNVTSFSPEVAWQSCDEYYSDAAENARSLIHASDVP